MRVVKFDNIRLYPVLIVFLINYVLKEILNYNATWTRKPKQFTQFWIEQYFFLVRKLNLPIRCLLFCTVLVTCWKFQLWKIEVECLDAEDLTVNFWTLKIGLKLMVTRLIVCLFFSNQLESEIVFKARSLCVNS